VSAGLLEVLRVRGFEPADDGWFDLPVCKHGVLSIPHGRVRVVLDDGDVIVYVLTGNGAPLWEARLRFAPLSVVTTVIDQAVADVVFADVVFGRAVGSR
jgi:hypothetical protein